METMTAIAVKDANVALLMVFLFTIQGHTAVSFEEPNFRAPLTRHEEPVIIVLTNAPVTLIMHVVNLLAGA